MGIDGARSFDGFHKLASSNLSSLYGTLPGLIATTHRGEDLGRMKMKQNLLALIAALFMVACSDTNDSNVIDDPDAGIPGDENHDSKNEDKDDEDDEDEEEDEEDEVKSACSLGDPNRTVINSCGFNSRGASEQKCVFDPESDEYIWVEFECVDTDVCKDGTESTNPSGEGEVSCGFNDRGVMVFECVNGQWAMDNGECDDTDVCTDGDDRLSGVVCDDNEYGRKKDICVNGQWDLGAGGCGFSTHENFYLGMGATQYFEGNSWHEKNMVTSEGQTEISISFWVKKIGDGHGLHISTEYGTSFREFRCDDKECQFKVKEVNSNGATTVSTKDLTSSDFINDYVLIVIVIGGNGMCLYKNGEPIKCEQGEYHIKSESVVMLEKTGDSYDHFSIFDRALDADEVEELYNYGL